MAFSCHYNSSITVDKCHMLIVCYLTAVFGLTLCTKYISKWIVATYRFMLFTLIYFMVSKPTIVHTINACCISTR